MTTKKEHCWHQPEPAETYSNGWESSEKVMCCWCGQRAFRVTRRLGLDRVEGHGPHHEVPRYATRIDGLPIHAECYRNILKSEPS